MLVNERYPQLFSHRNIEQAQRELRLGGEPTGCGAEVAK